MFIRYKTDWNDPELINALHMYKPFFIKKYLRNIATLPFVVDCTCVVGSFAGCTVVNGFVPWINETHDNS